MIENHGCPDYIKLDIEGYESDALRGLDRAVKLISFEANLPEFRNETIECLDIIHDLSPSARFAYSTSDELVSGELSKWSEYKPFRQFVENTSLRYAEVIATLKRHTNSG